MISSLHLHNFKCFQDQRLDLSQLTLLTGLNGMGKSSVIQSLLLLRQSNERFDVSSGEFFSLFLNGDLTHIGTAGDLLYEAANEEKIGISLSIIQNNELITVIGEWAFNNESENVLQPTQWKPSNVDGLQKSSLFSTQFHYLNAERIGPRVAFAASGFNVQQNRRIGSKGEFAAHFLSLFRDEDIHILQLAHPNARTTQLLSQVEAWLSEISPGTRLEINAHPSMDLINLQISFETGKQVSNPYRTTNVGFGLTYTLPILVAILSSRKDSLILIENPEAHLHPKGQARMGHLLALAASFGVQVIIETHSDHVLNGIRLAVHSGQLLPSDVTMHYFGRVEKDDKVMANVVSPKIDANGRIDNWPDGFFDEWDKSLEQLLTPRN